MDKKVILGAIEMVLTDDLQIDNRHHPLSHRTNTRLLFYFELPLSIHFVLLRK